MAAQAQALMQDGDDGPNLADLLQAEVTTASRRAQPLREVSAAAIVLSAEDLRRSGAQTLPEALRLLPGVEVAVLAAGTYAITVRGSNDRYANKLLVLVDGRSVYSPLSSGVSWELLDLPVEDIERIEVVRGPGAALWGSNAVNGVINILTRPAGETTGSRARLSAGADAARLSAAHSWRFGTEGAARLWLNTSRSRSTRYTLPGQADADTQSRRVGLRVDQSRPDLRRTLSLDVGETVIDAPDRTLSLTAPYEQIAPRSRRADSVSLWLEEVRELGLAHTLSASLAMAQESLPLLDSLSRSQLVELTLQHGWRWHADHQLVWGLSLREARERSPDSLLITYFNREPLTRTGLYVRDDWRLPDSPLRLSAGLRIEHQGGEAAQWEPTLRGLWSIAPGHTAWAAWSRASRLPVRPENGSLVTVGVLPPNPAGPPGPTQLLFDARLAPERHHSERLTAYELGYRGELGTSLFLDLALYQHRLRDLRELRSGGVRRADDPPRSIIDLYTENSGAVDLTGVEVAADWRPRHWLRLQGGLTHTFRKLYPGTMALESGNSPRWGAVLRASVDPRPQHEFDLTLRHVAALRSGSVPAYTALDLRYGIQLSPRLAVEAMARDLLPRWHAEFPSAFGARGAVELGRSLQVGATLRF